MKREIITTADGSNTIFLPQWQEHYHSRHGAIQEARHVFLEKGILDYQVAHRTEKLDILEMGLGTGLNAFLTNYQAAALKLPIHYTSIEAYPIEQKEWERLNYAAAVEDVNSEIIFSKIHRCDWEEEIQISPFFWLRKERKLFIEVKPPETFDLVFFDAFAPRVQPDLWNEEIFSNMFGALRTSGSLVTYCAKGSVRRSLQHVGFEVERLPGPPGKREMLRATKP